MWQHRRTRCKNNLSGKAKSLLYTAVTRLKASLDYSGWPAQQHLRFLFLMMILLFFIQNLVQIAT